MKFRFLVLLAFYFSTSADQAVAFTHKGDSIIKKGGDVLEKGAQDAGNAIEKGAQDAGNAIEKGVQDAGNAIEKGLHDTGDELERFAKRVCEDWLNIPDGECFACYTSDRGDGEDAVYACEDGDPDKGDPGQYPGDDDPGPSDEQLEDMNNWAESTRISHEELEPWSDGQNRFMRSKRILGNPLPEGSDVVSPTGSDEIRTKDDYGIGFFLAPRALYGNDGKRVGTRYHGGVDFVSKPGQEIVSPVNGEVLRVSNAYKSNNQGLSAVIIGHEGYEFKVLYTSPEVKKGDFVLRGQRIGTAQDLKPKFGDGMTNHIHLSIIDSGGKRVSPDAKWTIRKRE
ncbi:M23 family metallopeptidase [Phaeobacter sp. LSS9]|uniref:M23 family metallopeptidase n=1 Tax=unclassified Phaeobacter TaxID=2621772 RepID=UPI0013C2C32C|nr:M23 family metallopeptidase [Phaeobacter sp. LSS9]